MPSPLQSEITLCCSLFRPGMIKLKATIDRGGYCCGESLSMDIHCQNLSNRTIPYLRARFIRCLSINAKGTFYRLLT